MDFELGVNVVSNDVRLALPSLVSGGPIRVLHEDAGGGIWIGTDQGLTVLRGTNKENFTTNNGLAGNRVRVICSGPDGAVWVGTDHGLSRFKEGKITNWRRAQGLLHEEVSALHFDAEGNLWIGTMAGGLNCYAGGKLSSWTSKDGLFSEEIYEVIEDNSGYLWMSCRRGLFRVGKKELWDFQTGKLDRVPTTVFGKADGLLSVQFNGVAKPAAWKDRQGRLWFASIRGVVEVDPTIPTNERPPPIVIERVTEGREVLWPTNKSTGSSSLQVVVPPGAQEIQVRYSALSLSSPEKNQFSYKLEGAGGSAWTEASPDRVARYNRLPPGTYTFRVIGCNNDGVWNEKGASLEMTVLPRFWQTWWFRILAVSAFGAVTFLAYRARVSRLRELEGLRMSIAANLHDQVGARLTKVAMITEHVSHQVPVGHLIRPGIEAISRATAEVTKSMDEVVWTINPKNDTLENLANYMFHYAEEYFQDTSVRCLLDFPPHLPDREVPTRTRHHLFMTLKEALSNVLKHSRATETHIKLEANDAALKIEVEDNGQGFELQRAQKSGDGLTNMRQRIGSLGGEVTWRTKPGEGTQLTIEMPW